MTNDQQLILEALENAQRILAEYLEPGGHRKPEFTIARLLHVLDRQDLAAAQGRLKAGYGLRIVK